MADDSTIEARIRRAYHQLSTKPVDWVPLAALRPAAGGSRSDIDRVLLAMVRTGLVHLAPDSNRRGLTSADHAAAIRIGSEDKHLVAIEKE